MKREGQRPSLSVNSLLCFIASRASSMSQCFCGTRRLPGSDLSRAYSVALRVHASFWLYEPRVGPDAFYIIPGTGKKFKYFFLQLLVSYEEFIHAL